MSQTCIHCGKRFFNPNTNCCYDCLMNKCSKPQYVDELFNYNSVKDIDRCIAGLNATISYIDEFLEEDMAYRDEYYEEQDLKEKEMKNKETNVFELRVEGDDYIHALEKGIEKITEELENAKSEEKQKDISNDSKIFGWLDDNGDFNDIYCNNSSKDIILKCVEEMAELSAVLAKYMNDTTKEEHLEYLEIQMRDEFIDVLVTLAQLERTLNVSRPLDTKAYMKGKIYEKNSEYFKDGMPEGFIKML